MGGILDTWVTVFQSDTKSVDEGNKKASKSADELLIDLKTVDEQAHETGRSMVDFITNAAAGLVALFAAKASIDGVAESAKAAVALSDTADLLDENIERVAAFTNVVSMLGGEADSATELLTTMGESISGAMEDAESDTAKAFKEIGIGLTDTEGKAKKAIDVYLEMADAVDGLNKVDAKAKVKDLGVTDPRQIEMLLKGRKELERMIQTQKDLGVVTKDNAEKSLLYTQASNTLVVSLERAGLSITSALMPALTSIIEWFTKIVDWSTLHKDIVVGFFGAVAAVVTAIYLPAMLAAAAATLAATWPILAIIAAVTLGAAAFALLYDDVMNFVEGNDSFIGQMAEKYPIVKSMIEGVAAAFKFLGQMASDVWRAMTVGFQQVIDFVMRGVNQIKNGVSTVAEFFGIGGEEEPAKQNAPARPSGSGQSASDVPLIEGMTAGQKQLAAAGTSPLNSTSSNAISNANSNSKVENNLSVGEINVNAPDAKDADGIAKASTGAFDKQLKSMQESSANGRAR